MTFYMDYVRSQDGSNVGEDKTRRNICMINLEKHGNVYSFLNDEKRNDPLSDCQKACLSDDKCVMCASDVKNGDLETNQYYMYLDKTKSNGSIVDHYNNGNCSNLLNPKIADSYVIGKFDNSKKQNDVQLKIDLEKPCTFANAEIMNNNTSRCNNDNYDYKQLIDHFQKNVPCGSKLNLIFA